MRLVVDARILHARNAGSAYYTRGWLEALPEAGFEGKLLLIGPAATTDKVRCACDVEDIVVEGVGLCHQRWEQIQLPSLLQQLQPDVFISPSSVLPMLKICPQVNVVYDLGFETHPEFHAPELRSYLHRWVPRSCTVADAIVTLSEFGRRELMVTYGIEPERITICSGAAHQRFEPVSDPARIHEVRQRYGINGHYILSVCSLERNKNLPRLLEAFALAQESMEERWRLVLTGWAGSAYQQVKQLIENLGLSDQVIVTGFVPDDDLPVLYSEAEIFAFVSLYEGFGLPPLEAMACGTPVITSNAASLPEVVGDAGVSVDPENTGGIAEALSELMTSAPARSTLMNAGLKRSKHFSWALSAAELLKTCKELTCAF